MKHPTPDALLLMLLDPIKMDQDVTSMKTALMLSILDHIKSKQALVLTHRNPACGAVQIPMPVSVLVYV